MFDQVLKKQDFVEAVKSLGWNDEKVEEEWKGIEQSFVVEMFLAAYEKLSYKQRQEVMGEKEMQDIRNLPDFMGKMDKFLRSNQNVVDATAVYNTAVEKLMENYKKVVAMKLDMVQGKTEIS